MVTKITLRHSSNLIDWVEVCFYESFVAKSDIDLGVSPFSKSLVAKSDIDLCVSSFLNTSSPNLIYPWGNILSMNKTPHKE